MTDISYMIKLSTIIHNEYTPYSIKQVKQVNNKKTIEITREWERERTRNLEVYQRTSRQSGPTTTKAHGSLSVATHAVVSAYPHGPSTLHPVETTSKFGA